jgi:phosphoribosyl 1,2-cyclic phosphate phosphodiesterase
MKITMLGCGNSSGVPIIGCDCPTCSSDNPKNNRTRVSVYVETEQAKLLIDTSPDLRAQALRHNIRHVDAVLYTHDHADHVHGIDDVRSYNYMTNQPLPVYGDEVNMRQIEARFPYAFLERTQANWLRPALIAHHLPKLAGSFEVNGQKIIYFEQIHGKIKSLGYRIGDFAYSTDVNILPEESLSALEGVKIWIVDCLRYEPAHSHSYLENTLAWIKRIQPKRAVLTHMSHEIEYEAIKAQLPEGVEPGYDGLALLL